MVVFGGFGPALPPGAGRARLITQHEGLSLSTERDLLAERQHLAEVLDAVRLVAAARLYPIAWVQRLGYLLDLAGHRELADALVEHVRDADPTVHNTDVEPPATVAEEGGH